MRNAQCARLSSRSYDARVTHPPSPWGRLASLGLAVTLLAACSSSNPISSVRSSTTSTTPTPPTAAAPPDPWALPLDYQFSAPIAPIGGGPSFNESAGCGAPQGIRGPYAITKGFMTDAEAVGGPWGSYFGRDIGEVRSHLVAMHLPNGDADPVTVYVHERAVSALQLVIDNLVEEAARGNVYPLDPTSTSSFYPATIPPKRYLSFHAMGIAIDVNSRSNPYREDNTLVTDMPAWFVAAWTEAGWCWGGSWRDIKDPMHFSWEGPRYMPGSGFVPPMPLRTAAALFERSLGFDTALGTPAQRARLLIADVDRDGAPDFVVATPEAESGRLTVQSTEAIHRFDTCWAAGTTPHAPPADSSVLMADVDGDARPDLLVVGPDLGDVSLVAYSHASAYTAHLPVVRSSIPFAMGAVFLAADFDGDGVVDLWVVGAQDSGRLDVWGGPDYRTRLAGVDLPMAADGSWRFAVGDRGGDGIADLFALGPEHLVVFDGADGFGGDAEEIVTPASVRSGALEAGDFDGDGRADLYVLGADGRVTVYLGGDRSGTSDEGLMSWFLQHDDQPWEYREGCPFDPRAPK